MVAQLSVEPAAVVEGDGLSGPVAGHREQVEGLPGMVKSFDGLALPFPGPGEVVVDAGLPDQVA